MSQYGHFPFFRAYLRPLPIPPHTPVIQVREALAKMQGYLGGDGGGGAASNSRLSSLRGRLQVGGMGQMCNEGRD